MFKNVASQKIAVFAFDVSTGAAKTGDAANITVYVNKDWAGVNALTDTSATEIDATNAAGWYLFDVSQTETNADVAHFTGKSSTANVSIVGQQIYTRPPNFSSFSLDSSGRVDVIKVAGTTQTAGDIPARLPAALVSGRIDASVGAMAADTLTSSALATSAVTEIQTGLSTLDAAGVRTAVGLASANLDTQLGAIDDYIDTEVAAIKAKTDLIPASPAAVGDIPTATQNADALLNRDMSAVSDTNSRSPLNALRFLRNKWSLSGSTLTVTEEDDTTTAWTAAVTTNASADPITGSDPA